MNFKPDTEERGGAGPGQLDAKATAASSAATTSRLTHEKDRTLQQAFIKPEQISFAA
jgi:hypothetical protein